MTVDDLKRQIEALDRKTANMRGSYDKVLSDIGVVDSRLSEIDAEIALEKRAQELLSKVSEATWIRSKGALESLVSKALRAVFTDRNYEFRIDQSIKRDVSSLTLIVVEGDVEIDIWAEGGRGVAAVIGFALQVAYLVILRPAVSRILFMDEPFAAVQKNYIPALSNFVRQVAKDLELCLVVITHNEEMAEYADQVLHFEKTEDGCQVIDRTVVKS